MFFKSVTIGATATIGLGVLAFCLSGFSDAVGIYFKPAELLIPIIGPLIPSAMIYRLAPDGGPQAGIGLILICAFFFWTIVFGTIYCGWVFLRGGGRNQGTMGMKSL